jgi:hypothetical protein
MKANRCIELLEIRCYKDEPLQLLSFMGLVEHTRSRSKEQRRYAVMRSSAGDGSRRT